MPPALRCRCRTSRPAFSRCNCRVETLVTTDTYVTSVRAVPSSRAALLFTAIAATIVMLPWAINGLPGDDNDKQPAEAPQVAQQPLTGLGGGETIREVHQDTSVLDRRRYRRGPDGNDGTRAGQETRRLMGSLV